MNLSQITVAGHSELLNKGGSTPFQPQEAGPLLKYVTFDLQILPLLTTL